MTKIEKIKALLRHFLSVSSFFLSIINFALCLLLFALLAFLAGLYFKASVDLPQKLEEILKQELKKEGLILEAKSIKIDFRANIIVEKAKLRFVATASDFLSAERLGLGFSFDSLFFDQMPLDYIFVEDAELSPVNIEATDLSLLSKISFFAQKKGHFWTLYNFKANLGALKINSKASIDARFFAKDESKADTASDTAPKKVFLEKYLIAWEQFSKSISKLKDYADNFTYANLMLEFDISEKKIEELYLLFRANKVDFKLAEHDLLLDNIRLGLRLDSKDIENKEAKILARAKGISTDKDISARQLNLRAKLNYGALDNLDSFYLSDLNLWADNIDAFSHNIDYVALATKTLRLDEMPKSLDIYLQRGSSYVGAIADISKHRIDLDLDFFERLDLLLEIPQLEMLKDTKVIKAISFDKATSLKGKATFFFEEQIAKPLLDFDIEAFKSLNDIHATAFVLGQDVHFAKKHIEEVYGRVDLDLAGGDLFVKDAFLTCSEGWSVDAQIYQGLYSKDYIFQVGGRFEPSCLDNLMAHWWTMVFEKFELMDYPDADVFVGGTWGEPEFTFAYAKVAVAKAKYNDYAFEDISLIVNVNPSIVCAYDVHLKGANGYADAYLAWVYPPSEGLEKYIYRNIVASVDMNFEGIKALGGEDVEEVIDIISFEDNVSLSFDLYDLNPRRDPDFEQKIRFDFNSENPLKVSYFTFDSIEGRGNVVGRNVFLKDINASFIDGELEGDFSLENVENKHYFKTKLEAKALNQGKILELIEDITNDDEELKPKDSSMYLGKVDSLMTAEGFLLDFNSYKAQATLSVANRELRKVSIFGGISRVLESFKIPLTTLEFTNFDGDFTLENGIINLSKLEIRSATSTIFGKALYTAMTDSLSARMYFNWKTSSRVPILGHIADFMFDPILDSILIVVSNTFTDPSFSLRVRPFNIFNSAETMIDNIDADSL